MLTKEEIEERIRKKFEAVMKRERAMAYAYSHQVKEIHVFNFETMLIKYMKEKNCKIKKI